MKKAIIFICAISFLSCKKEKDEPNQSNNNCTCGIITDDGYEPLTGCYWLEVQNDCSDNKKTFCFDYDVWLNNFVGDRFCVYNVNPW